MKLLKQKMVQMTMIIVIIVSGVFMGDIVQAQDKFILSMSEITVKSGQERQFENGIKAWKACYLENKGEWTWTIWKRYNGKGSVYVFTSRMANWAELDENNDEAGKKCWQIAIDNIMPHVESTEDNFARNMPEISKTSPTEWGVIWVTLFKVENSTIFNEIIKEVSDIMVKAEGENRAYWYSSNGGSPESPDYFVVTPFKNFAALDVDRDGVWKMVENSKGKEATEKMRANFRSAVSDMWSYMYKRMGDLSNDQ